MKKLLFVFLCSTVLQSCSTDSTPEEASNPSEQKETDEVDTISIEDDTTAIIELTKFEALLEYPEDIMLYKSRKQGANNGSARGYAFYHKPDTTGFYYRFLLFHPSPPVYDTEKIFKGFDVVVYRYGNKIGHYGDTNEEFISMRCEIPDPALRKFDLVDKPKSYIDTLLGDNFLTKDNLRIYTYSNKLMVVSLKNDRIEWFKYTLLNFELTHIDQLPKELSRF